MNNFIEFMNAIAHIINAGCNLFRTIRKHK